MGLSLSPSGAETFRLLTATLWGRSSRARHWVSPSRPYLLGQYADSATNPISADLLLMFTTLPPPRSFMEGRNAFVRAKGALRFTAITLSQWGIAISSKVSHGLVAALFTRTSSPPYVSRVPSTTLLIPSSVDMSAGTASASPPPLIDASTDASSSTLRATITTSAPSRAYANAMALPKPLPEPVTKTALSLSLPMVDSSRAGHKSHICMRPRKHRSSR